MPTRLGDEFVKGSGGPFRDFGMIRGFMTDGENPTTDNQTAEPRDVPVDWEALEDAFENNAPEVHSYLHLKTGEVLRVVDGIADPEMHSRIASDSEYMRVEPVSSREQYRWMERFIPLVEEGELRQKLLGAIDGKGAFRRFKDVLMGHVQERERWFAFRSERLRVFMEAWLGAHAMRPIARPVFVADPPVAPESPGSSPEATACGRRGRGSGTAAAPTQGSDRFARWSRSREGSRLCRVRQGEASIAHLRESGRCFH